MRMKTIHISSLKLPVYLLLLLALPFQVSAQDITGVWTGYLQTMGSKAYYELAISDNNDKLGGYSLTIFTLDGVENAGVKSIKLKNKNGKISLEDDEMIYNNYATGSKRILLIGNLSLIKKDTLLMLEGTFTTRMTDMRYLSDEVLKGKIHLRKQKDFSNTKLITRLEDMNLLSALSFVQPDFIEKKIVAAPVKEKVNPVIIPKKTEKIAPPESAAKPMVKTVIKPAADIAERKTEIITTVYFQSEKLLLSLYDNGQIDGDTVSVVLNGKVIMPKMGLTAKAITQSIDISDFPGDSLVLVMYAENLGTIPPNTGLLILQDGESRHEIRFAGDLKNNSAIILKKKPEKK